MIPKIIHQSWKTKELKPEWIPYQESILTHHADWEYKLHTDEDNLRIIGSKYPEFLECFISLPSNIMRADAARYVYMYVMGGLYADLDYEFLKPFDLCDEAIVLPISRESASKEGLRLGNCVFASVPGHPFWKELIDSIISDPPQSIENVEESTGPMFLTRIYQEKGRQGYLTPARNLFHPITPKNENEYQETVQLNGYGIHHCHGTWRKRSGLLGFLRRKLK